MNAGTTEQLAMEALWEAETAPVRWIQGWGDWLAQPFALVTELGSQNFFIVVLTLIFWSVHPGIGARLFVAVLASGVLNYLLKAVIHGARPHWFSAQVIAHSSASSFGTPSGHAQASVVMWGYLGVQSGRRAAVWAAVALIALVSLSRVYLGVHFVSDVLAGLLLGGAILWAALRWEDRLLAWWSELPTARWVAYTLAPSILPCLAATGWQLLVLGDWSVPAGWMGATPTDPDESTLTSLYTVSGALLGGVTGFTLLHRRGWYSAAGTVVSRVARFALGISVVVLIQVVVDVVFGGLDGLADAVVMFAAYAGIAFWASFGAPEMFVRSGLAGRPDTATAVSTDAPSREDGS